MARKAAGKLGHKMDPRPYFSAAGVHVGVGYTSPMAERMCAHLRGGWLDHTHPLLVGRAVVGFLTEPYRLMPAGGNEPPFAPDHPEITDLAQRIVRGEEGTGLARAAGFWNPPAGCIPLVVGRHLIDAGLVMELTGDPEWVAHQVGLWWEIYRAPATAA